MLQNKLTWRILVAGLLVAILAVVAVITTVSGGGRHSASALQAPPGGPAGVVATSTSTPCVRPANDDAVNDEVIKSLPFTTKVDPTCATQELFEAQYCKPAGGTVWYQYTPRGYGDNAVAKVTGSGQLSLFYWVFYKTQCAYSESGSLTVPIYGTQGLTYFFQVSGCCGPDGSVTFDLQPAPTPTPCPDGKVGFYAGCGTPTATATPCVPPANDDFANAEAVTSQPFSVSISTTCATSEAGEPPCRNSYYTVWYAYTATKSDIVQVDTFGSDFDTSLGVYNGNSLASLKSLGCDDDAYPSKLSAVRFKAIAGTTYFIQAGGYERGALALNIGPIRPPPPAFTATPTATPCPTSKVAVYYYGGCGTITPTFTPTSTPTPCPQGKVAYYLRCFTPTPTATPCSIPANDNVANATIITSLPFSMTGSTQCATKQPNEPGCGYSGSVWLRYTAESSARLRASVAGYGFVTGAFKNEQSINCGYDPEFIFDAQQGVTYYFRIAAQADIARTYTFSLEIAPPPTPTRTPCEPGAGLYYDNTVGQYVCMTPTPTPTPCPEGKVLGLTYPDYQSFCGTPTPTFTPCPPEKVYFYD